MGICANIKDEHVCMKLIRKTPGHIIFVCVLGFFLLTCVYELDIIAT